MNRPILVLTTLLALAGTFAVRSLAKDAAPVSSPPDHILMQGPSCPPTPCAEISLQDQVRHLIGHWPRDFKIAVVQATEPPKCRSIAHRTDCYVKVKLTDLLLGTQEPDEGFSHTGWNDPFEIFYTYAESSSGAPSRPFEVKSGDRLVAMLTPAMHPPNKPPSYIATRLDHASDAAIQSVGAAIADVLRSAVQEAPKS
jgi:hypothetical protein